MKLLGGLAIATLVAACGDEPLPAPIAQVDGVLGKMAVNDTSIFAIVTGDGTLLELGLDGTPIGPLPTIGEVIDVAAAGDLVAWVEVEGTGTVVKRRIGDAIGNMIESQRTFAAHVIATDEGLFYSDLGLVASWMPGAVPERIATPGAEPRLLDVDATFAYTIEADTSVVKYQRTSDTSEVLLDAATDATVKNGELAYRTDEGVRKKDLFMGFDRVVGAVPAGYACELLIAGSAVLCGKFRANEGTLDELLRDPVTGYAAVGSEVYWGRTEGAVTALRVVDAEAVTDE
jgi:hypothetical protein